MGHSWVVLLSPKGFVRKTAILTRWLGWLAIMTLLYGVISGLWLVPPDYQQGDAFRIIYVHVPCAILSLALYLAMAVMSGVTYVWRIKIADSLAKQCARMGICFTLLALLTGAIWGKPMWGTWWVWDGRLTSELVLFFLYAGVILLRSSMTDAYQAARACALLSIVGVINLPIIHYSVYWWHTLHQQSTLLAWHKPSMATEMLIPLLASILGFSLLACWLVIQYTRVDLLTKIHGGK